jgi:hypothetical protein
VKATAVLVQVSVPRASSHRKRTFGRSEYSSLEDTVKICNMDAATAVIAASGIRAKKKAFISPPLHYQLLKCLPFAVDWPAL